MPSCWNTLDVLPLARSISFDSFWLKRYVLLCVLLFQHRYQCISVICVFYMRWNECICENIKDIELLMYSNVWYSVVQSSAYFIHSNKPIESHTHRTNRVLTHTKTTQILAFQYVASVWSVNGFLSVAHLRWYWCVFLFHSNISHSKWYSCDCVRVFAHSFTSILYLFSC